MLKIAFVGLGSIGTRHLNNLYAILQDRGLEFQIDALRNTPRDLPKVVLEKIHEEFFDVAEMPDNYDIIFITNPTALHYSMLKEVNSKSKHFFIEKPLFESTDYSLENLKFHKDGIYYVACPLRYKACLEYVEEQIKCGLQFLSARAISSSYLPDWRPGTDYRKVYSANKQMGGGVSLDLIHEWDYLTNFFGMPETVMNLCGHFSKLEMDSDDISVYIAKYADKLVEVHLDYVGRRTVRTLELLSNESRIDVDIIQNTVTIYQDGEERKLTFPQEDIYVKEMNFFLDCIEGKKKNTNSIQHAYDVLGMILGV